MINTNLWCLLALYAAVSGWLALHGDAMGVMMTTATFAILVRSMMPPQDPE